MTHPDRNAKSFAALGVPDDLVDALSAQGIDAPFAIQAQTIPPALAGGDVSGRAPTGSGKTLAFGVPLVANVERARPKRPRALVLVPTRELAAQVSRDLTWLGAQRDVRVHAFYGGTKFEPQVKALRRGVDIAVACPGRLADLVNQGIVRLDGVDLVVIDEADRMADMGFLPEVRRLVDQTDDGRQTLLFSATLDGDVDALVRRYQHDPVTVDVTPEVDETSLEYHFWSVPHAKKIETAAAVIARVGPTVVFTRTRYGADRVTRQLERAGVEAIAIHGNRSQNQRERALRAFRAGQVRALVATDVAARGIHVDDVTCVIHFDLPADPKDFIHRSGRTGRAGATGVVVALAMPDRRKDNNKLFRALEVDVTVTEPNLEAIPIGPAPRPGKDRMNDRDRSEGGRPNRSKYAKHKPTGKRTKRPASSPAQTKAGRTKGAPARFDRDPDEVTARRNSSGNGPGKRPGKRSGDRDTREWQEPRSKSGGSSRSKPKGARSSGPKSPGPKSPGPKSRGPRPQGPGNAGASTGKPKHSSGGPRAGGPAGPRTGGGSSRPGRTKSGPARPKAKNRSGAPKNTGRGKRAEGKGRPGPRHG